MELYLLSTVRLSSCEPIIHELPSNRWWSLPSPRPQPAKEPGELEETDRGSASDFTQVCVRQIRQCNMRVVAECDSVGEIVNCPSSY